MRKQLEVRGRTTRGQSLVEFTFAIPLLLLAIFGIIYFGRFFYITQTLSYAAQEGARVATRVPNLNDPAVRAFVRGFDSSGAAVNPDSPVYAAFSAAKLLSQGATGDLPPDTRVKILPWDADGSDGDYTPPGTVSVRIQYPYQLLANLGDGGSVPEVRIAMSAEDDAAPVTLHNVVISERATVSQEVFQEVN